MKQIIKQIKDFPDYCICNDGTVYSIKKGKLHKMVGSITPNGYKHIILCKDGQMFYRSVHRLVAQAFIPNPENKPYVNHINGVKDDNRVENLEWVTDSENKYHSYRVLKNKGPWAGKFGKDSQRAKIILQIKDGKIIAEFYGSYDAYRKTGISASYICDCCNGKHKTARGYQWKYK